MVKKLIPSAVTNRVQIETAGFLHTRNPPSGSRRRPAPQPALAATRAMAPAREVQEAAATRLCEFLVVATHAILERHGVYPSRMFQPRRKYGVVTPCSKHPALSSYIARVVGGLHAWLAAGALRSVSVAVFAPRPYAVLARYTFDVGAPRDGAGAAALAALDAQLRAHLCRLLATPVQQVDGAEWDFIVRTTGVRVGPEWVPADGEERREIAEAVATPLKDADLAAETFALASRVEFPAEG